MVCPSPEIAARQWKERDEAAAEDDPKVVTDCVDRKAGKEDENPRVANEQRARIEPKVANERKAKNDEGPRATINRIPEVNREKRAEIGPVPYP